MDVGFCRLQEVGVLLVLLTLRRGTVSSVSWYLP
jgi:hypothetical protein